MSRFANIALMFVLILQLAFLVTAIYVGIIVVKEVKSAKSDLQSVKQDIANTGNRLGVFANAFATGQKSTLVH